MSEMLELAKRIAERAGKNAKVAPELLYAPILWELQDDARRSADSAGQNKSRVMCIGWPTIQRLMRGESVWFEELGCGAVAASDLLQASAESVQDFPGLVQDLPLIWQGWCNAIRLMEDKATVRRPENAAQAAAYEQCAKDLKEALTRPARTEPQASADRDGFDKEDFADDGAYLARFSTVPAEPQTAPDRNDAAWALLSRWENIAKNGGEKWLREHPLVEETTKILNQEDCSNLPQTAGSEAAVELIEAQAESADTADLTQQEVTTVINWAKEHDLPIPAALFAHFKMFRLNQPQAETTEGAAVADQIIGQIEERFPNWRSYRDLIDCIDCTLHQLRSDAVALTHSQADSAPTPPLRAERERRMVAEISFDPTNHHNALKCPYCNPKGLAFAEPQTASMASDDPTASKEWNDGCDFAMTQLCKFLGVEPSSVSWDASTETVEGDVSAVICNILRAKFGEDWGPQCQALTRPLRPDEPAMPSHQRSQGE